jgi:hypothetical protein
MAGPGCEASCRCQVQEELAPAFASAYYGCRATATCQQMEQDTCLQDASTVEPSATASAVIQQCQQRDDCAGIPCELLTMFGDSALSDLQACLQGRNDCVTCLNAVSAACP